MTRSLRKILANYISIILWLLYIPSFTLFSREILISFLSSMTHVLSSTTIVLYSFPSNILSPFIVQLKEEGFISIETSLPGNSYFINIFYCIIRSNFFKKSLNEMFQTSDILCCIFLFLLSLLPLSPRSVTFFFFFY